MLGLSPWVAFLAVVVAAAVGRLLPSPSRRERSVWRLLQSPWAPAVAGLLSAAATLWVWRTISRTPVLHDESAYLLQAELFATGRWSGSAPPLPAFFQQLYVLVEPVLASKYPPGHSLVLTLGVLLGAPALPVIAMNGLGGGLVFALARRVSGPATAALTWLVWMTSFPVLYYHANYMSQSTTSLTWLVAWWGLLRWREAKAHGWRWLALVAAALGWCVITRPMTALALCLVVVAVVLRTALSQRSWRDLIPAAAIGCAIVALLPLWSWRTTGSPVVAPLTLYTSTYVPFDKPGFGVARSDRPSSRLPRDQWITSASFYQEHARHTVRALPRTARDRIVMIAHDAWYEWRGGLASFALVGLLLLSAEGAVVVSAFALQFLLYLTYAHPARWTIYYVECAPVLAYLTALGIARVLAWGSRETRSSATASSERFGAVRAWLRQLRSPRAAESRAGQLSICMLGLAAFAAGVAVMRQVRAQIDADHEYHEAFASLVDRIADPRAVVFVRYGPTHNDGLSLVRNVAVATEARVWTVYDRGTENAHLLQLTPDRVPYLFDEASWTLRRLQRPAESTRTSGVASGPTAVVSTPRR